MPLLLYFTHTGFVLGFDMTVYDVSESSGVVEICVQVFNPPNHLHFSTIILLRVITVDGSASNIIISFTHSLVITCHVIGRCGGLWSAQQLEF